MCVVSKCVVGPTTQSGVNNANPTVIQPGDNAPIGVYDGGNSGIGAANHRHAGFNSPDSGLKKMLVRARRVAKPAVICHVQNCRRTRQTWRHLTGENDLVTDQGIEGLAGRKRQWRARRGGRETTRQADDIIDAELPQNAFEGNIFPKRCQVNLVACRDDFALAVDRVD